MSELLTGADYTNRLRRLEEQLRPMLTDEFLGTLVVAARTVGARNLGWGLVDYADIEIFVREVFDIAGKSLQGTDLEPYLVP